MEPLKFNPTAHAMHWIPTDDNRKNVELAQAIQEFLQVKTGANWTFEIKDDLSAAFYGARVFSARTYRVQPGEWVVWFLDDVHLVLNENMW